MKILNFLRKMSLKNKADKSSERMRLKMIFHSAEFFSAAEIGRLSIFARKKLDHRG